jgi:hypothetical protein
VTTNTINTGTAQRLVKTGTPNCFRPHYKYNELVIEGVIAAMNQRQPIPGVFAEPIKRDA